MNTKEQRLMLGMVYLWLPVICCAGRHIASNIARIFVYQFKPEFTAICLCS
jgi:hypothetical protein